MIYTVSDVHGRYTEFLLLLGKISFCETDTLYVLGDVVDRGKENLKMLEFCRSRSNVILLKGNHELFMQRFLEGSPKLLEYWKAWGGDTTQRELESLSESEKMGWLQYLRKLPIYQTIQVNGKDYLLTHSGFSLTIAEPVRKKDGRVDIEASIRRFAEKDEWEYLVSDDLHQLPASVQFDRYIICGHYPTLEYREEGGVFISREFTDIDCGCAWKLPSPYRKMACLCLDTGETVYQDIR